MPAAGQGPQGRPAPKGFTPRPADPKPACRGAIALERNPTGVPSTQSASPLPKVPLLSKSNLREGAHSPSLRSNLSLLYAYSSGSSSSLGAAFLVVRFLGFSSPSVGSAAFLEARFLGFSSPSKP